MPTSQTKNTLDQYEKLDKLAEGGFGEAWLVRKKNSEQNANNFVMKKIKCFDQDEVIKALREMVTLRILQCRWVVKYYDYIQDGLNVYLFIEYCIGGDLYREMNRALKHGKVIDEDKIMRWFVQISLGLSAIHEKKFIHRDIKPSNVFLDKQGNAKLGDFGLTNIGVEHRVQRVPSTLCGTPGFISPELKRGKTYDVKSDVWALACTLYELVCLRSAYSDSSEGIFPHPIPEVYSDDIRKLLSRMLIDNEEKRPSVTDILAIPFVNKYVQLELAQQSQSTVNNQSSSENRADEQRYDARNLNEDNGLEIGLLVNHIVSKNWSAAIKHVLVHPILLGTLAILAWMLFSWSALV